MNKVDFVRYAYEKLKNDKYFDNKSIQNHTQQPLIDKMIQNNPEITPEEVIEEMEIF